MQTWFAGVYFELYYVSVHMYFSVGVCLSLRRHSSAAIVLGSRKICWVWFSHGIIHLRNVIHVDPSIHRPGEQ